MEVIKLVQVLIGGSVEKNDFDGILIVIFSICY
ncbi:Hypothetical Protein SLY_1113 [Strawberry lethal yellows phytoplasma (CPA) str. NZSb11]|uniref:Uncharacterized protein n=1 Tax=Strawberry lethal yellows phytoplasma (CPA) str. NZSb11 TaxID=980422 RepID=R4S2H3_PHYAS|nr:Hypothetical Protein SLY_1113 [Strawberry lethal yellows phytoplasma (CPA) str. NZSb11]